MLDWLGGDVTLPVLREALICAVDNPRSWGQRGSYSERYQNSYEAMCLLAEKAVALTCGERCFFCDAKQEAREPFRLHPGTSLCECLTPFRRMAFDYIENWEVGTQELLAQVEIGKLPLASPVYQFFCCTCGKGPIIIDVRVVVFGLTKYNKHVRRRMCDGCYQKNQKKQKPPPTKQQRTTPAAPLAKNKPAPAQLVLIPPTAPVAPPSAPERKSCEYAM